MSMQLNNQWTYDVFVHGVLYTTVETRELALAVMAEYRRLLRFGMAI